MAPYRLALVGLQIQKHSIYIHKFSSDPTIKFKYTDTLFLGDKRKSFLILPLGGAGSSVMPYSTQDDFNKPAVFLNKAGHVLCPIF